MGHYTNTATLVFKDYSAPSFDDALQAFTSDRLLRGYRLMTLTWTEEGEVVPGPASELFAEHRQTLRVWLAPAESPDEWPSALGRFAASFRD